MSRWLVSTPVLALAVCLSVAVSGCGSSPASGCTVDADCTGNGWCQEGACQAAYVLSVNTTPGAAGDARVHANGVVQLRVTVSGGGGRTPAAVTLSFVDDGRLQAVAPPDYAYAWDTSASSEGSRRVKATVAAGSRTYESPVVEVVVDRTAPAAPVPNPLPAATNANPVVITGTAEERTALRVLDGATQVASLDVPVGGAWTANLSLAEGTHSITTTATDLAGNASAGSTPLVVNVDRTPPAAPVIGPVPSPTSAHAVAVTGTAEAGTSVELTVNGAPLPGAALATGGNWSQEVTFPSSGTYALQATAVDAAGNRSPRSATTTVVVDQAVVAPPSLLVRSPTNEVAVAVRGATLGNASVNVFEGSTPLAHASADPQGAWAATVPLAEGRHLLKANATNGVSTSDFCPEVEVVVDRTPPQVARSAGAPVVSPAAGTSNVWSRSPITVTFDEAMLPSSATDASVVLAGQGGAAIASTRVLSGDGRTLTIRPASLPSVPNDLTLTLGGGLTDLAGNALAATPPWSWTLPTWQEPADPAYLVGNSSTYHLGLDGAGDPVLGVSDFASSDPAQQRIALLRWDGQAYAPMADLPVTMPARVRTMAVDAGGRVAVAWDKGYSLYAAAWDGSAWVGGSQVLGGDWNSHHAMGWERTGNAHRPVLAWVDTDVKVVRLEGSSWVGVGTPRTLTGSLSAIALTFDADDHPRVGWIEERTGTTHAVVHTFDGPGGTWTSREWEVPSGVASGFAGGFGDQNDSGMAVDATGRPVLAWIDRTVTPALLRVSRVAARNEAWETLGGSLNVDASWTLGNRPALAVDGAGNPVVGWFESTAGVYNLFAKRWRDPTWEALGDAINSQSNLHAPVGPRLAVTPEGIVGIAWWESYLGVKVKRFNR